MDDYLVQRNPKPVGQGDVAPTDYYIIGPRYFEAINRFPAGTPITFGLNMAYYEADYLDQVTAMAEAAVMQLDRVNLTSFEMGNEPNIYLRCANSPRSAQTLSELETNVRVISNGLRNETAGNWTGATYVDEWKTRVDAVYSRVLQPAGLPAEFFEGACSASLIQETFGIEQLVLDGMQAKAEVANTTYLTSWVRNPRREPLCPRSEV